MIYILRFCHHNLKHENILASNATRYDQSLPMAKQAAGVFDISNTAILLRQEIHLNEKTTTI